MKGTLIYKPLGKSWMVIYSKCGDVSLFNSLPIHPDTDTTNLKDFDEVEFEIEVYGLDPYDNQFPGIDYYDVAVILDKPRDWRDVLKNHVNGLIKLDNGHYMELISWLEANYEPPTKKIHHKKHGQK